MRNCDEAAGHDAAGAKESGRETSVHAPGGKDPRRGAILLMILTMIVILSAVVVQFTEKGMAEVAAEGHFYQRDRLRLVAYSALETTLGVLADVIAIEGGLTAPQQGWADPLGIAGFETEPGIEVSVSILDESGKVALNRLDEPGLVNLFTEMGLDYDVAVRLAESLLDWTDNDDDPHLDGAESDVYEGAEWPFQASNRPIRHLSELAVIDGFNTVFFDEAGRPNDWYRMFADAVSVYSDGRLNANSVSDLALYALGGMGDPQVQAVHNYLAGPDGVRGTPDDRYFANREELSGVLGELPPGIQLGIEARILRIRVEVVEGGGSFAIEAVVRPDATGQGGGRAAAGAGSIDNRRNARGAPGNVRSARGSEPAQTVPYPFVFLELREDVGHNDSIAAPAEPVAESAGG